MQNLKNPNTYYMLDHIDVLNYNIHISEDKEKILDDLSNYGKSIISRFNKEREDSYLTNIPSSANNFGVSKVLAVRSEIIHIKHILTEIFVRRSVDIEKYL